MLPKKFAGPRTTVAAAAEPKQRKPRKPKQKPNDMSNTEWDRDVHRRRAETQGRKDRLQKFKLRQADEAAEAEEEAATVIDRNVAVARAQISLPPIYVGQYPHGWNMGLGSPAGFSPSSPAMFQEPYGHLTPRSRLSSSPSPDKEGFAARGVLDELIFADSPALRPGPLPFSSSVGESSSYPPSGRALAGMQGDSVMHDIIASGSAAGAAAGVGYYIGGGTDAEHGEDYTQDGGAGEEEDLEVEEVDPAEAPSATKAKGKRKNKAAPSTPTEVRVKWTTKEDECLAEAWKEISIDAVTGANQCSEAYWSRVKTAFDERKFIETYFRPIHMDRGSKAMGNHWGVIQAACSKWHGIQDEIERRPESGADMDRKMVRAYQMYRDDNKNAEFKFLHVFTRIETCKKWTDTRAALAKGGVYNPMAPVPGAAEG